MAVKPAPKLQKLVIIEDGLLATMASNKKFLAEFPFLKGLQRAAHLPSGGGCGGCGGGASRRARQTKDSLFGAAKAALVGMGDNKKRKLKQLLNTKQVRVTFKQGTKVTQHTF